MPNRHVEEGGSAETTAETTVGGATDIAGPGVAVGPEVGVAVGVDVASGGSSC
jgi:hypothetical protein